jgi:hypothetical protein
VKGKVVPVYKYLAIETYRELEVNLHILGLLE